MIAPFFIRAENENYFNNENPIPSAEERLPIICSCQNKGPGLRLTTCSKKAFLPTDFLMRDWVKPFLLTNVLMAAAVPKIFIKITEEVNLFLSNFNQKSRAIHQIMVFRESLSKNG